MGTTPSTPHTMHNTPYNDHLLTPSQSQLRIQFTPTSRDTSLFNSHYLNKTFQFNEQSLAILTREQIVQNNFSQQFDPLFTTFRPENKNNYGKCRVLCSNITNEKIQEYRISFRNEQHFRTYLVSYFWRKNPAHHHQHTTTHPQQPSDWPLVRTTNLMIYPDSKNMLKGGISGFISRNCTSSREVHCKVYVEDIPLRLCHIKDIPFPQNLYVLRQTLKGFHTIYENIGYIKPFQDLVCITRKGTVKVWINSDLSKNFPNIENIEQNVTTSKSQSKLINDILHLITTNTDPFGEPVSFPLFLKEEHVNMEFVSFQKVFQMIDRYEARFGVEVPGRFASIMEVFNQQEEEYDTYRTDMEQEQGDEERGESSQPVRSQNNNRSNSVGLFLDVPNSGSRHRISGRGSGGNDKDNDAGGKNNTNSNNKKKNGNNPKNTNNNRPNLNHPNPNLNPNSSPNPTRPQKAQSLRISHHRPPNSSSLSSSSSLADMSKPNMMLSQSLPIPRNLQGYQQHEGSSSKEIGVGKREREEEGRSRVEELNEGNFVKVEKRMRDKKMNEGYGRQQQWHEEYTGYHMEQRQQQLHSHHEPQKHFNQQNHQHSYHPNHHSTHPNHHSTHPNHHSTHHPIHHQHTHHHPYPIYPQQPHSNYHQSIPPNPYPPNLPPLIASSPTTHPHHQSSHFHITHSAPVYNPAPHNGGTFTLSNNQNRYLGGQQQGGRYRVIGGSLEMDLNGMEKEGNLMRGDGGDEQEYEGNGEYDQNYDEGENYYQNGNGNYYQQQHQHQHHQHDQYYQQPYQHYQQEQLQPHHHLPLPIPQQPYLTATHQQLQHMLQIDRFLQLQVIREENEKVRLQQVYYKEQGKMLNRSVNEGSSGMGCCGNVMGGGGVLGDSSGNSSSNSANNNNNLPHHRQHNNHPFIQHNSPSLPLPPPLLTKQSSHPSSHLSPIKQNSNQYMHSSQHVGGNVKELREGKMVGNSHVFQMDKGQKVEKRMRGRRQHVSGGQSEPINRMLSHDLMGTDGGSDSHYNQPYRHQQQHTQYPQHQPINPNSITTLLPHQSPQPLYPPTLTPRSLTSPSQNLITPLQPSSSFQHTNTLIEIQPPSSSRQGSSRVLEGKQAMMSSLGSYQGSSAVVGTESRHIVGTLIVSNSKGGTSQMGLVQLQQSPPATHMTLPPLALVSSTSIGHSIHPYPPPSPHNQPPSSHNPPSTHSPQPLSQHTIPINPKVTFAIRTPSQHQSSANLSSTPQSLTHFSLSVTPTPASHPAYNLADIPLSISNPGHPSFHHIQRLGNRTNTAISAYVHSQGGQSSRKYYQHEESSSYSKPSIVEYSYLRNPELFNTTGNQEGGQQVGQSVVQFNASQEGPVRILERSQQNSLERIPVLEHSDMEDVNIRSSQLYAKPYPPQLVHHYSHHSARNEQPINSITPIPEQVQAQMMANNSRINNSFINNSRINNSRINNSRINNSPITNSRINKSPINDPQSHPHPISPPHHPSPITNSKMNNLSSPLHHQPSSSQVDLSNLQLPESDSLFHPGHKRSSSGIKIVESEKEEREGVDNKGFEQEEEQKDRGQEQSNQIIDNDGGHEQEEFVTGDKCRFIEEPIIMMESDDYYHDQHDQARHNLINRHPQVKINIRPSFESMAGMSENLHNVDRRPSSTTNKKNPQQQQQQYQQSYSHQQNRSQQFYRSGQQQQQYRQQQYKYYQRGEEGGQFQHIPNPNLPSPNSPQPHPAQQPHNPNTLSVHHNPRNSSNGSNIHPEQHPQSNYRFVESVEENRPNSAYQTDIDALERGGDFVVVDNNNNNGNHNQQYYNHNNERDRHQRHHNNNNSRGHYHHNHNQHNQQDRKMLNTNFSGIHHTQNVNAQSSHDHSKRHFDRASHSPTESQNQSPRLHRLVNKPVTGRTMFMNNDNQLMSEFIDPESQLQSQVDYTYNSYDKWKDKSRIANFGPSRFREFDQREEGPQTMMEQQQLFGQMSPLNNRRMPPTNPNAPFNYPQRHINHKQLVKSSIEGTKFLNHHFSNPKNLHYNTDTKRPQQENQQERKLQLAGLSRLANQYHQEEEIDQEILRDLGGVGVVVGR